MTQNVNEGHSTRSRNRRQASTKPANGEVTTITVDPALWRVRPPADVRLVIDSTTIIACNSRKHRDYLRKVLLP